MSSHCSKLIFVLAPKNDSNDGNFKLDEEGRLLTYLTRWEGILE